VIQLFGDKLRYLRIQRHLTQKECAELLGLARHSHISNLESGRKTPSLELVRVIARQFAIPIDYLLRDTIAIDGTPGTSRVEDQHELQFAANLRILRTHSNLTQVELAKNLGISQWHLSHLETESKGPSLEILLVIADFFRISIMSLLYSDNI
jgi:transcriptional regulator with XRE-family HTH domain